MQDFKEQIRKIAIDLLNLEVNTIIKSNIEGIKMPEPRHALLDIAKTFDSKLKSLGAEQLKDHNDLGGYAAFDQLRTRANQKISELETKRGGLTSEQDADLLMLYRIKDKSDQIKGMFNSLKRRKVANWDNAYTHQQIEEERPPFPLTPDELVLLRKVWELGTEEIALQTIIQLDGDVVTRIQPKYITSNCESVHKIHNQGVSTSMAFWKELIGIVTDFFSAIVRRFF